MIVDLGIRAGRGFFFIANQGQMETEKRSHLKAMRWRKLLKLRQHDPDLVVSLNTICANTCFILTAGNTNEQWIKNIQ